VTTVWLGIQGRSPDFKVNPGELGVSEADAGQVIERLRAVDNLETLLAEIRHRMVQRQVLFGERLPKSAREFGAVLDDAS
jgi:hypothetical protein